MDSLFGCVVEQSPDWTRIVARAAGQQSDAGAGAAQLHLRRVFLRRQPGAGAGSGIRRQPVLRQHGFHFRARVPAGERKRVGHLGRLPLAVDPYGNSLLSPEQCVESSYDQGPANLRQSVDISVHYVERSDRLYELDLRTWIRGGMVWAYHQLPDGRELQTGPQ